MPSKAAVILLVICLISMIYMGTSLICYKSCNKANPGCVGGKTEETCEANVTACVTTRNFTSGEKSLDCLTPEIQRLCGLDPNCPVCFKNRCNP